MKNYVTIIEHYWQNRDALLEDQKLLNDAKIDITRVLESLDKGEITVASKDSGVWEVNQWVKKAILLSFKIIDSKVYQSGVSTWYDKVEQKFQNATQEEMKQFSTRLVPGSYIRKGAYVGSNTVIMPSFINIGAYVDDGTLVDTWATIGSCAYVGKNCHISGGVGIGGVLEPIQANPVIIEDNCFIGARSEIAEGVLVEQGSVISMGVFLGASTKIVDRNTGEISYGKVPAYSVVVPGFLPAKEEGMPGLACAVIVKRVDQKTREKTSINELLRSN
ncbi:MAG: 2,3,4,5-tetrahydropyridine-2,6-dicarboxylate N-succinyltransferase [Rickettsiales bacterium]|nr:2,3,4,5-tetrahydropyridine-2,6-dicarboxylate N-succinyltransferase [Rickettsiales bacterium]MCA0254307.1 2,3,4,5-tetrahydropyridine-2,6-dicarboxylate N-succinyltransferase [Pseudomonadota bacterium]